MFFYFYKLMSFELNEILASARNPHELLPLRMSSLFCTPKITHLRDISSSLQRQTFLYFYRLAKNIKTNTIYFTSLFEIKNQNTLHTQS